MGKILTRTERHPRIIAHRGNSSDAPENTETAFKEAIELNVDFIECDVQLSKDGIPVVIHDSTFHRITQNSTTHSVDDLDLEEIRKIDAGSWFGYKFRKERILTLEDFLCMPKGKIGMMIDVKEETFAECHTGQHIAEVIKFVEPKIHMHGPVLIGSLNPNVLFCIAGFLPEQQFIPIVENLKHLDEFRSLRPKHYAFSSALINKKILHELHEEGAEVWVWTVDSKPTAKKLMDLGIDGIITNMPKKMLSLHSEKVWV